MINDALWNLSVEMDKKAAVDKNYFDTEEGQACATLIKMENERLKQILRKRKQHASK